MSIETGQMLKVTRSVQLICLYDTKVNLINIQLKITIRQFT